MRRRPDRSLGVIGALEARIVVLQEADKRLAPRPAALPHDMVEARGWRILPFGAQGSTLGGSLGWHGNAMLVRADVDVRATHQLELPGLEPRGAILGEFDTAIGPLRVVGLHLGLIRRYRVLQLAAIMRRIRRLEDMPTLLAGDFNEWGSIGALDGTTAGLRFAKTPPSFPALRPIARLDRFAISGGANGCGNRCI